MLLCGRHGRSCDPFPRPADRFLLLIHVLVTDVGLLVESTFWYRTGARWCNRPLLLGLGGVLWVQAFCLCGAHCMFGHGIPFLHTYQLRGVMREDHMSDMLDSCCSSLCWPDLRGSREKSVRLLRWFSDAVQLAQRCDPYSLGPSCACWEGLPPGIQGAGMAESTTCNDEGVCPRTSDLGGPLIFLPPSDDPVRGG